MTTTSSPRREVCLLIGRGGAVLWSDASASPVLLPDSRARWDAIWQHRHELEEVAHSHPVGPLGFSHEDDTTMTALCGALGRALRFSVVAPSGTVVRNGSDGPDEHIPLSAEPWWTGLLRLASGMQMAQAPEPLIAESPSEEADGDPEHHV